MPVVGGHTNLRSPYDALAVAVLGMAAGPVLSARAARPGDHCHLLIDPAGAFRGSSLCWDAATAAEPARLRRQLALLAELAAGGCVHAAKDISMGGLVGTAAMFCEAAGCGLSLDLEAIQPPAGVALEAWLTCFPSFGFLLAARPEQESRLAERVAACGGLRLERVGSFSEERRLVLRRGRERRRSGGAMAPSPASGRCRDRHHGRPPGRAESGPSQLVVAMPEVELNLDWPDGSTTRLYSPSTVILEHLAPGQALSVQELRVRGSRALQQASERVRARYGFACTRADEEEQRLLEQAARFGDREQVNVRSLQA